MNKVIQLLESTKQKQEESLKQLPKMVDEHVATVAVEGEQFIKEIDQALLVLSDVVGRSEQLTQLPQMHGLITCECGTVYDVDIESHCPYCGN